MTVLGAIFLAAGIYFFVTSILNILTARKIKGRPLLYDGPLVSVCIPARNEEKTIAGCLSSISAQTYKNLEILVLDDNSEDNTARIVREFTRKDPRIRYIKGKPLPPDWRGKTFAMQQLTQEAKGEYLMFTDADTVHKPDSLANSYSIAVQRNADFVSGCPRENAGTFFGRVAISSMAFPFAAIPLFLQEVVRSKLIASCIGQHILIKKSVLLQVGGIEAIKGSVTEDYALVRLLAGKKYKTLMTSYKDEASCKMYHDLSGAIHGLSRILVGLIPTWMYSFLVFATLILVCLAVSGIASLVALIVLGYSASLMMIFLGSFMIWVSWFVATRFEGFSFWVSLSQPIAFIMIVIVYDYGVFCRLFKRKITWKGRAV